MESYLLLSYSMKEEDCIMCHVMHILSSIMHEGVESFDPSREKITKITLGIDSDFTKSNPNLERY